MGGVNKYKHSFTVLCCNNQQPILYELTIKTDKMIMVERIVEECAKFDKGFHEDIADKLFASFGGKQTIKAHHHGVDLKTVRQ